MEEIKIRISRHKQFTAYDNRKNKDIALTFKKAKWWILTPKYFNQKRLRKLILGRQIRSKKESIARALQLDIAWQNNRILN